MALNILDSIVAEGLQPKAASYKATDGHGLYLLVLPSGRKSWRQKYRFQGREKTLTHGFFPEISIDEARARRDAARTLLAAGIDPGEYAKEQRAKERDEFARLQVATKFTLDSNGVLSFRIGNRTLTLTPSETTELRVFLDATRSVISKR